ncbi:MAG: DUF1415 domain-containing protein [Thiotrichaceae bacterium]|nr:DUF1415 domain-containing protein [Thiotrichaceae bacterium]
MKTSDQETLGSVIRWFEKVVLGLNLCPFAAKPYRQGAIRFELSQATNDETCLTDLLVNLNLLDDQLEIETLVVIIPNHLKLFSDYNQFLDLTDAMLEQQGWMGIYQIASFHPDYVFADCDVDDRANWTNRSPYPLLHLIRESSINKAVDSHPDINAIPQRNVELLRSLNDAEMKKLFS